MGNFMSRNEKLNARNTINTGGQRQMFVLTEVALQTGHGQEWLRITFEIADFASLENKQNKSRNRQNHRNKQNHTNKTNK